MTSLNAVENMVADIDPEETQEWVDALTAVRKHGGSHRAQYILDAVLGRAAQVGLELPQAFNTSYVNTIPPEAEPEYPGDIALEKRIDAIIRWNAMAMVVRAARTDPSLGGHIGTFASSATLYDVGFNHFWRASNSKTRGDLVFVQGHTSPGIYARSFLEGRLKQSQLQNFRQEAFANGLSSYPHPWLMPDYWQFATVSMGLGPMQAIYQARFMRYLEARGLMPKTDRKIWCFCGDGEMDEPESLGALSIAAREGLDNLIFVINCNLQRLDGPVRGNSKIVQELERIFRGNGWNVLKVLWGGLWDPLFAKDKTGLMRQRMEEACDGDYQNYKAHGGEYTREHFFGKYPELKKMVEHMSDKDIWRLNRGGHDPIKVYAAYKSAVDHKGQPTVILAKTVKGYGLGAAGEAQNIAHNIKKVEDEHIKAFRDRFKIPVSDEALPELPFYRPKPDSEEAQYMAARREALGGGMPHRVTTCETLSTPGLDTFKNLIQGSGEREMSTTMAFVRILTALTKDKQIGKRIVPIVPDEARTFGMEGLFRQLGIYSAVGQKYEPVDSKQIMFYKESKDGQILEEGINEAGAFSSWMAAGTSYTNHGVPMIPFYVYYSMFGFQRIGDFAWAAGDMCARGFLVGGTAGRTTINGEGLQHEDGHSHILSGTIPNCISYDPAFGYELAVIIQHGMERMYQHQDNVFYYMTTMTENYHHPAMPEGAESGIIKGMYRLIEADGTGQNRVQLLGSGAILNEAIAARDLLKKHFNIDADVWSVTSYNELRKDGLATARQNRLNPLDTPRQSYVESCLGPTEGPVIAATDYMKLLSDSIREFVPRTYITLGTDGFGRSDSRANLRKFFEVDRYYIAHAAVYALVQEGKLSGEHLQAVMEKWGLDPNKPDPLTV